MMNKVLVSTFAVAIISLGGCAGTPQKVESLESARVQYQSASATETVARHAPDELDAARVALDRADKTWRKKGRKSNVDHYAYLASQRVKIARLIADRKEDDAKLESMQLERQRVQLDLRSNEIDKARAETLALQKQLEEMQATVTARGIVATLGDVLFDSGKAELKASSAPNIEKIASFMRQFPKRRAIVEGHTDSLGDDDYNHDLSRARAFNVRTALVARGIDPSRITTSNRGESTPIASNDTREGRQQNRRVEVVFPDIGTTTVSALAE